MNTTVLVVEYVNEWKKVVKGIKQTKTPETENISNKNKYDVLRSDEDSEDETSAEENQIKDRKTNQQTKKEPVLTRNSKRCDVEKMNIDDLTAEA